LEQRVFHPFPRPYPRLLPFPFPFPYPFPYPYPFPFPYPIPLTRTLPRTLTRQGHSGLFIKARIVPETALAKGVRLLIGAGAIDASRAETSLQLFDDVRAMTWRLLNR